MAFDKKQFQEMKTLFDPMSKGEFLELYEKLIELMNSLKQENKQELKNLKDMYEMMSSKMGKENADKLAWLEKQAQRKVEEIERQIKAREKEIEAKLKAVDQKLQEVKDGADGKDADEERIIEAVKSQIKIPEIKEIEKDMPVLGTEIRNALELLQDDDRLELSAVKGLNSALEELRQIRSRRLGGGGFSKIHMESHFSDDETPSGTVNGTNKVFTIAKTPNPTGSLKVYVNGQKMTVTEDYTLSGSTITFVTAPPAGSIVRVDYRF